MKSSTRNNAEGTLHKHKGKVKETVGKIVGNPDLKAKGKKGKSALIAAMKKLLQIIYGVLKTGQRFNPVYEIQRAA